MKILYAGAALLAATFSVQAADFQILSLAGNGQLTFTNAPTNGIFTVQWAPALPATNWNSNWDSLRSFPATNSITTVSVPMFYRVTCLTNQFFPMPIGRRFLYNSTTITGTTGTFQITCLGSLMLSSDKEYTILELLTPCSRRLLPIRVTDTEVYDIPFEISPTEGLEYRDGPPGTTWTNQWCDGSSDQKIIATNETVTVPAGTFNCLKIEQREINNGLTLKYEDWVKPGFGLVKQIDYSNGTVTTNVLASWGDRLPR